LALVACGLLLAASPPGLAFLLPARKRLSFDEEGLSNQTQASKTLDQPTPESLCSSGGGALTDPRSSSLLWYPRTRDQF